MSAAPEPFLEFTLMGMLPRPDTGVGPRLPMPMPCDGCCTECKPAGIVVLCPAGTPK